MNRIYCKNVKSVNPWLVELVSNMPAIHLSPFSPPRKSLCSPHLPDFSLNGEFSTPSFSGNPLGPNILLRCLSDKITAGIQGARHAQNGVSLSDLLLDNKLQLGLLPPTYPCLDQQVKISDDIVESNMDGHENLSCLLSMGDSLQKSEKTDNVKIPQFLLFGQPILTEQQISDCSSDAISNLSTQKSSLGQTPLKVESLALDQHSVPGSFGLDAGHCKVFLESENVGQTLDLSLLGSYEELYKSLENLFGFERSEMLSHVFYRYATGAVKQAGEEPFNEFTRSAKRLTILTRISSNSAERKLKLITGLPGSEFGLESSKPTGPLSIFAYPQRAR